MMSKTYWINWAEAAGIRAVKTFAEAMLGFVGVSGIAIGDIDWAMALGVSAAATVASVLMSVVGLPEVSVDEDGDLVIDATPTRQLPRRPLKPLRALTRSNRTRNESVTCNGWRSFFMPVQHKQPAA